MANRILFVIYTPYIGYLPKRMAELERKHKLDSVAQIVVTPDDFQEKLAGQQADTVHLIGLHPEYDTQNGYKWWSILPVLKETVEKIKTHNI
jgi:hypothetical protein